ncbi:MAG TPA: hypothetical protein PKE31_05260 [Pseudomonadota bacterium]|jgi:hypothetical protein|nr:hypothetical protein [Pseudomonadota bacterium]
MRAIFLLLSGLFSVACSSVGSHSFLLHTEAITRCDPSKEPACRPVYVSCDQLGLTELTFRVGVFEAESTTVACPENLSQGPATLLLTYRLGEPFYVIDTTFSRDGLVQNASAGPFSDADTWDMLIR